MRTRNFIVWLFYLVWSGAGADLKAQADYIICADKKGVKYQVNGDAGSIFHWNVEGGAIISDSARNIITVNWNNVPGYHTISVFEETSQGCLGNFKKAIIRLSPPPVLTNNKYVNICKGDQIDLDPGAGFNTYRWQDGSTNPKFPASAEGTYWVEVTNQDGCSKIDTIIVAMNNLPVVNLGKDTMLCGDNQLELNAQNPGLTTQWSTGANGPTILASENDGQIWVKVIDDNGCAVIDSIQILKCTNHGDIIIPNAFTPNGDGHNDTWIISGSQNYPNMIVKIYNRWGALIFESDSGYFKPWDGFSNGTKQPVDAYYYLINLGDGSKEIVGSITLIR